MNSFSRQWYSTACERRCASRTRRIYKTPIATAVAAALYLGRCVPLYAADEQTKLEEVVVTATRRNESIQNIPYNIAAVNSDMIQQLQMNKIDDVARFVPGIAIQDQGAAGSSNIVARGLNTSALGASATGPNGVGGTVIQYFGDVPLFFDFKLLDIDRVEALLGPQGTLYGAGTLGGLIRYIPKKPDLSAFGLDMHVRLTSQEHGTPQAGYDGDVAFNVPLIEGQLALRAVVGFFHDPGFTNATRLVRVPGVSNPTPNFSDPHDVAANLYTERGVDFDHTFTARATLLYKPNDALDAELTYMHQRTDSDGPELTHTPLLGTGPYDSAFRVPELAARHVDLTSLVLTGHLGFADLVSATSYARRRLHNQFDNTDGYVGSSSYTSFPQFVAIGIADSNRDLFTEELRLVSSDTSRFRWILGGFYEYFKDDFISSSYVPGYPAFIGVDRPDQLNYYELTERRFSDKAVFGELGYQLTSAWQVTVGGRALRDQINSLNQNSSPLFDGSPPTGLNLAESYQSIPSYTTSIYKFNTSYRFTPDLMSYVNVSDGYREGNINVAPPCGPTVTHNCLEPDQRVVKPDRTRNYELGLRSTWFDKRLTLNGAIYYTKWKDVKIPATNSFNAGYITNASSALSEGIETQFQAQLSAHLSLLGSYTYNEAHLTADAPRLLSDQNGTYDAKKGDRLPGSPRQMGSVNLRYSQNLPSDYALSVSYGIHAQSNLFSSVGLRASGEKLPGYATHFASLNLGKNNWDVTFFVENLLNKYAFTGMDVDRSEMGLIVDNGTPTGFIARNYYHSVLQPRLFGLEARMSFGKR